MTSQETDDDSNSSKDDTATAKLTRRDALIALGAAGVGAGGLGTLAWDRLDDTGQDADGETAGVREVIVAAAEALYPEQVSGIDSFVETYVVGRIEDRSAYLEGVQTAARDLDRYARHWHDQSFADLDRSTRQAVFDDYGLADRDPDPDGTERQRVRYYLVNELLFAFYSSPTGGSLIGLENPPGHPGGLETYQRGSPR